MDMSRLNATTDGEGSLSLGSAQNEAGTRVDSKVNAQMAMGTIDAALDKIASYRGDIGALQNRLDSTDRNLSVQIENLTTAKSRIKDADFATETAEFAQNNILTQAGASVLTQANQLPSIALKLLQN
jgi:flagellin